MDGLNTAVVPRGYQVYAWPRSATRSQGATAAGRGACPARLTRVAPGATRNPAGSSQALPEEPEHAANDFSLQSLALARLQEAPKYGSAARGGASRLLMVQPWPLAAWPAVPTSFLLCRDDRMFPPAFPRRGVWSA